ncbi:MAG: hypothetical protein AAF798_02620 [Bacteroidota bacterium]
MAKVNYLTFTGIALLLAGIVMLISEKIGVGISKILIPLLFITGGIFSVLFSQVKTQIKAVKQYQLIHGVGLILFGIIFGLVPNTLSDFLSYATYFILFFGFIEITICFALVNSDFKFKWGDLISRFISGFFGLIGGVLILATTATDQFSALAITGIITALMGIGIVFFSVKLEKIMIAS